MIKGLTASLREVGDFRFGERGLPRLRIRRCVREAHRTGIRGNYRRPQAGQSFVMSSSDKEKPDYLDVLVVAAAPVDLRPALNLGAELAKLEDMARRSAVPIRMRRVFPPTFVQLDKELSVPELERWGRKPRVLHFLGHGEIDGEGAEGRRGGESATGRKRERRVVIRGSCDVHQAIGVGSGR